MQVECKFCYFYSRCKIEDPCEHFYPISDDDRFSLAEEGVEQAKIEYREAWFDYLGGEDE